MRLPDPRELSARLETLSRYHPTPEKQAIDTILAGTEFYDSRTY